MYESEVVADTNTGISLGVIVALVVVGLVAWYFIDPSFKAVVDGSVINAAASVAASMPAGIAPANASMSCNSCSAAPTTSAASTKASLGSFTLDPIGPVGVAGLAGPVVGPVVGQAFGDAVPANIALRQATDFSKLNSNLLVPSAGSTYPQQNIQVIQGAQIPSCGATDCGGLGAGCDPAGDLMSAYAPRRSQLVIASNYGVQCMKRAQINGRSARSRILGQTTLLRPPAPIPAGSGQGTTFLDSELRHAALEQNTPPIACC